MLRFFAALALLASPAWSEDRAGDFDYYVLSLSWSANWCAIEGDSRNSPQCDPAEDHGWILHGLWPQYEQGFPANCSTSMRPPSRSDTGAMADIMGTSGLAWHQSRGRIWQVRRRERALRQRQDDVAQHHRRLPGSHVGVGDPRWRPHQGARPGAGHGLPAGCPV